MVHFAQQGPMPQQECIGWPAGGAQDPMDQRGFVPDILDRSIIDEIVMVGRTPDGTGRISGHSRRHFLRRHDCGCFYVGA